ncbi:protein phosphatase 2c, putative [Ricinus communis]|uniref:Protein phosphatase 2c, putative n=1 Tax=Ricinus communis TaxID=3988 RepID=B9SGE6_RICCO|nr:protein phosphatase 2c, putative [Ricinus communis]
MVSTTFMRIVAPCWKPSVEGENSSRGGEASGRADGLLWYKDSGHHVNGEFSMAVIQANNLLEDCSQLESGPMSLVDTGPQGTFVGVYDGHGGPEAARFVNEHLFENIKTIHGAEFTSENHGMSADVINKAFLATEEAFLSLVQQQWNIKPQIASVGACCLVGYARKLLKAALREAAKKREMRYSDLKKIDRGVRRHFHDDITVIVLFLDSHLINRSSCRGPLISIRGGNGIPGSANT